MTHRLQDSQLRNEIMGLICNFQEISTDELKSLMSCDDATLDLQFTDGATARSMERTRQQLLEENRRLAQENVDREARFFELRNRLLQMYHEGKQLKQSVEQQESAPQINATPPSLDTIQALLETAAREAEDASERIANDFIASSTSVEQFLEAFIDSRKELHLRRVCAEKATELLRARHRPAPPPPMQPPAAPFTRFPEYQPPPLPNMGAPPMGYPPVAGPMPAPPPYGPASMPRYGPAPYLPYPAYPSGGPLSMPTPGS